MTTAYEIRPIDPAVLDELRVRDDAGHPVFIHPERCPGPEKRDFPNGLCESRRVPRAYSGDGRILRGRLVEPDPSGETLSARAALAELFADPEVALVHARAVEFGCFTFEIRRTAGAS